MVTEDLAAQIRAWVDRKQEHILRLTEDLIRFRSVNRRVTGDEKACQMHVAELLGSMDLEVDVFEPPEVAGFEDHPAYWPGRNYVGRPNVVGRRRGTGGGRSLLFTSHADVVPALDGKRPPFEPTREDGRLYGRGSSDMKGGLAATIGAVQCLQDLRVPLAGDVIIESVVDEEFGGANGTLASRLRGYQADAAICPEPNGMDVSPAHRGGALWEIVAEGTPGVPFGSTDLKSPAYAIAHLAVAIESWQEVRNERAGVPSLYRDAPGLPVILSTLESIHENVGVPAVGRLEVWAEVYPGTTFDELRDDFMGHLETAIRDTPVLQGCTLEFRRPIRFLPGSQIHEDHPIVELLAGVSTKVRGEPARVRGANFACDAFMFNLHSPTPCVILGPRGGNAHAPDEWVLIDDLLRLTEIFALTAVEWCGVAGT